MKPVSLQVTRRPERFLSDDHRVIARFFTPNDEGRIKSIIDRVLLLSESEAAALLEQVYTNFTARHKDIQAIFARHYNEVRGYVDGRDISETRQQLLGAYFTMEYSFESAALFNPSIVPHPNQDGLPDGAMVISPRRRRWIIVLICSARWMTAGAATPNLPGSPLVLTWIRMSTVRSCRPA